jgi:hypothetical protein
MQVAAAAFDARIRAIPLAALAGFDGWCLTLTTPFIYSPALETS